MAPTVTPTPSASRLGALRRRYHELGSGNPFAAQELEEVRERLEGLESQQADLFAFPTGNFHIPLGTRLRFTVVPMDGPDLVITTGGPIDEFDAAMARTKPMLDSLQIGD